MLGKLLHLNPGGLGKLLLNSGGLGKLLGLGKDTLDRVDDENLSAYQFMTAESVSWFV